MQFQLNPKSLVEGFTQSELSMMSNCSMKWNLGYNMMLRKRGSFSWALIVGSAFHSTMEQMYATKGKRWERAEFVFPDDVILTGQDQQKKEYWEQVLQIMLEAYAQQYKDDFTQLQVLPEGNEMDVDLEFEGIRLRGKIDLWFLLRKKEKWMMDHKTTSRLDRNVVMGWDFRFQFMFYLWLLQRLQGKNAARGMYINAIKKPQLRQGEKESLPSFVQRIRTDYFARPETYFYREPLRLMKESMEHFENVVLRPKIEKLKLLCNPDVPHLQKVAMFTDMNTDYCQVYNTACQFLPICQHGLAAHREEYIQKTTKHEELEDSATNE
jgi:hypothetical protein